MAIFRAINTLTGCYRLKYLPVMALTSRSIKTQQLIYEQFGEPVDVVQLKEFETGPLKSKDVLLRMVAAPINPADINSIQGKYPLKINLPCVPGNEGVGEVIEVGKDVSHLSVGKRAVFVKSVLGTWRPYAVIDSTYLREVPSNLGNVEAATLTVNPCTAYRMLKDFVDIKPGMTIIQNGANSACGQNVIQICKAWGINSINVVRNRPNIEQLKAYLKDLGATYVLTEEELRKFKVTDVPKPILGLNCIGGKSSLEQIRQLDHGGKVITYGGMSREPVTIPTAALIFKKISFHGYWMTHWYSQAKISDVDIMFKDIVDLMLNGKLKGPVHKLVKFENYKEALANTLKIEGYAGCKYILDFTM